jgi:CheY-like chemotaxis protein
MAANLARPNNFFMRILFADDQNDIRLLTKQQLEKRGHRVVAVANGVEALRAFQQQPFDAVLLDEQMPGMTGTEVVRAIREKQKEPVVAIALTGFTSDADTQRLLAAGFDSVLGKPFRIQMLDSVLQAASGEKGPQAASSNSDLAAQTPEMDLLSRVGGDEQLLQRMARTFLKELPSRLAKIQKSIEQKKSHDLASLAHAFKGTLSIFGADQAAALCKQLQEFGRTDRFADAAVTFASLKEAIAEVQLVLRGYAEQKRPAAPGARPPSKSNRRNPESNKKVP